VQRWPNAEHYFLLLYWTKYRILPSLWHSEWFPPYLQLMPTWIKDPSKNVPNFYNVSLRTLNRTEQLPRFDDLKLWRYLTNWIHWTQIPIRLNVRSSGILLDSLHPHILLRGSNIPHIDNTNVFLLPSWRSNLIRRLISCGGNWTWTHAIQSRVAWWLIKEWEWERSNLIRCWWY